MVQCVIILENIDLRHGTVIEEAGACGRLGRMLYKVSGMGMIQCPPLSGLRRAGYWVCGGVGMVGSLNIHLPDSFHHSLEEISKNRNISISQFISAAVDEKTDE